MSDDLRIASKGKADQGTGNKEEQPLLLVIVGPTAVGKTALSLNVARRFQGEIVSADSRLFYRGMDIGTAKPTEAERAGIPHHLIDIREPDEMMTLAEYQRQAYRTIDAILERGNLPLLVGGTGQYIRAVVEGWGIPEVAPQPELRAALEHLGGPELARWLARLDPEAAERIDARNVRRVIRALEVTLVKGRPISELQRKEPPPYTIRQLGLTADREWLYERIDRRVEQMIEAGLVDEVETLLAAGYDRSTRAMSGLGYRQLLAHLAGELTLEEAIERIKFETHRFARQQYTWFRLDNPAIHWYEVTEPGWLDEAIEQVARWLA